MLDVKVLWKVRTDAIDSIKKDSDGDKVQKLNFKLFFLFLWYFLPLFAAGFSICMDVKLSDLQNYIGASVALFTGLFFSLLLSLGDKLRIEKANENVDINNFKRFKENMRQISSITQFVILVGVIIFVILLLNSLTISISCIWIESIWTGIAVYFLFQYTILIGFLLQRFHHTLKDELNNTI